MNLLYAILMCLIVSSPIGIWGYKRCRKEKESILPSMCIGFVIWTVAFEYVAFASMVIYRITNL